MSLHPSIDDNQQLLNQDNFREVSHFIRPKPDEVRWLDIPWQTDLRDASRLAMETGKPVFLWAMNGNPLGCT